MGNVGRLALGHLVPTTCCALPKLSVLLFSHVGQTDVGTEAPWCHGEAACEGAGRQIGLHGMSVL
jgi:hypothetical protein